MRTVEICRITIAASALTLMSAGCAKTDVPGRQDVRQVLFMPAPVRGESTRAVNVSAYPATSTFGTYAYMLPSGKTWDADRDEAEPYIFGADNKGVEISKVNDVWKNADRAYYWPAAASLTFFSYSPYGLDGVSCSREKGIRIENFSIDGNAAGTVGYRSDVCDLLVSNLSKDLNLGGTPKPGGDGAVPVVFRHILSKVKVVAFLNGEPDAGKTVTINSVSISNIYGLGTYDDGQWSGLSGEKAYSSSPDRTLEWKDGKPVDAEVFPEMYMIPQVTTKGNRAEAPEISVTVTKSGEAQFVRKFPLYADASSLAAWEQGKAVVYHISVSVKDEYIEFDGSLEDWRDSGNNDINIGVI